MTEEFLHFIWKYRMVPPHLRLVSGDPVEVIEPGECNTDGGPDFFNARVRIGETIWIGNVEMHVDAEDWYRHRHHQDRAYDNVILHVVAVPSVMVRDRNGQPLPMLVLDGTVPDGLYGRYRELQDARRWIPCENQLNGLNGFVLNQWDPVLCVERMEERVLRYRQMLEYCRYNWEETFHILLCRSFGFRVNTLPFELLGKSLPVRVVGKHKADLFQLESLLFGQAGMLGETFTDEYPKHLSREYEFQKQKYGLKPIRNSIWKYLRMRPSNFPTVRIAQLAALLHRPDDLFTCFLSMRNTAEARELFSLKASDYWDDHFLFGKQSSHRHKFIGPSSVQLLVINFVVPFLFLYGEEKGLTHYKEKGLEILEELPPEASGELARWKKLGIHVGNALQSQAMLHLKLRYCDRKRCLYCRIGKELLSNQPA